MSRTGILLSGGIDSIALAYWKRPEVALTVDYGQVPAEAEVAAAVTVCEQLRIAHDVIRVDCRSLGTGQLAGTAPLAIAPVPEWWPFRNQLVVTLAAQRALSAGVSMLQIGIVKSDRQHVDGSPDFVRRFSELLAMQEGGLALEAPAIDMTSVELVRASGVPFEVLAWAHSCHTRNLACGRCRGCAKHFQTMKDLGFAAY